MLIIEKEKDIGILKSLGADRSLIRRIFVFEGWMISILGALTGLLLGVLICWLQQEFGLQVENFVAGNARPRNQDDESNLFFARGEHRGMTAPWHALDPTNDRMVGSAHVLVARGRDYADVPPLKGIYAGGQSEGLGVTVEITQL